MYLLYVCLLSFGSALCLLSSSFGERLCCTSVDHCSTLLLIGRRGTRAHVMAFRLGPTRTPTSSMPNDNLHRMLELFVLWHYYFFFSSWDSRVDLSAITKQILLTSISSQSMLAHLKGCVGILSEEFNRLKKSQGLHRCRHHNFGAGRQGRRVVSPPPPPPRPTVWVLMEGGRRCSPGSARVLPHQDSGATVGLFSLRLLSINQKITLCVPLQCGEGRELGSVLGGWQP